jgi:hypothetical protein
MNVRPTASGVRIENAGEGVHVPLADIPDVIELLRRAVTGMAAIGHLEELVRLSRRADEAGICKPWREP